MTQGYPFLDSIRIVGRLLRRPRCTGFVRRFEVIGPFPALAARLGRITPAREV